MMEKVISYWNKFPDFKPSNFGMYIVSDGSSSYSSIWANERFVFCNIEGKTVEDKTIKAWMALPKPPTF